MTSNRVGINWGATGTARNSALVATADSTYLMVLKFVYAAGGTTIEFYVNPPLSSVLPVTSDGQIVLASPSSAAITGFTTRPNTANILILDELRIGTSVTAVIPFSPPIPTNYTISGTATNNGTALSGATITDGTRSTATASDGSYTLTDIPSGSYTLTPSKTGYTFTPTTLSVLVTAANLTGQNFTALTPTQSWFSGFNLPTDGTGDGSPTEDPDGDGVKNLLEYALGGNPTSSSSGTNLLPTASTTTVTGKQRLTLTFTPQKLDLSYAVESSGNLTSWPDVTPISPLTSGVQVSYTDGVDIDSVPKRFLRLRVTQP